MNTLVTATQHLSQPCGPLPIKDCRVRHEGNENGKKRHFRRRRVMDSQVRFSDQVAQFLQIAMGSACELEYHLLLAHDFEFISDHD